MGKVIVEDTYVTQVTTMQILRILLSQKRDYMWRLVSEALNLIFGIAARGPTF